MYSILYRNARGNMDTVTIYATTEAEARNEFSRKYDGRIVSVTTG